MGEQRSRTGCSNCKRLGIKCDEKKPRCTKCIKSNLEHCNYKIKLKWRHYPKNENMIPSTAIQKSSTLRLLAYPRSDGVAPLTGNNTAAEGQVPILSEENTFHCETRIGLQLCAPEFLTTPSIVPIAADCMELLEFFKQEASLLFIVAPERSFQKSPFFNLIPSMALHNDMVMNAVLAFSAAWKNNRYLDRRDDPIIEEKGKEVGKFWNTTVSLLHQKLSTDYRLEKVEIMVTMLLLAAYDLCFFDAPIKWRAHIRAVRDLLSPIQNYSDPAYKHDFFFFKKSILFISSWLSYIEIMSSLCSPKHSPSAQNLIKLANQLKYSYSIKTMEDKRLRCEDIENTTGMDPIILSFLAKIAALIKKLSHVPSEFTLKNLQDGIELDEELAVYIDESEKARDQVLSTSIDAGINTSAYRILRATNLVFALTGRALLKKRVFDFEPRRYSLVKIIMRIMHLIESEVCLNSSAESCIFFPLFCCGCELISSDLLMFRSMVLNHLDSLINRGISSAVHAKLIMKECWMSEKPWWLLLEESGIDLVFNI
ncbi:LAFE_0B00166g1_1 [Lachancea fermentati]|uniref:LAFE_0B00166g1_1 n=1 Tax=Lachancea fermentati TaxID=4955 RepID=A0A1G4M7A1_LACFM|nr:LAFE_0B00166g1_1 [Lachancea fermentati]